ncbi:MAG: electron transfer flavoprotein subunit alpha/FixB family protein [Saprospiraceae bacterium]|nr:electron transfer flavoprotein subunit alpha/FixB family protein [Saprospiraceae bacterium]
MIITVVEIQDNKIKKTSLEALSLASKISEIKGIKICAVCIGSDQLPVELGSYGADEVILPSAEALENDQITSLILQISKDKSASHIVLSLNSTGKNIASVLAAKLNAGLISGVIAVQAKGSDVTYTKNVFSGKATATYSIPNAVSVIAVSPNSIPVLSDKQKIATKLDTRFSIVPSKLKTLEKRIITGKTPLAEASIVVSAGRGLKDPSNWNIIEDLADLLGATTACSRPVSDIGWRPHHEHVGQTGLAIRPNVYIAIGISGAIQHLAGVNNSRKIIVINKDPEAPFFKAADYGICGDLFEIVPKLNEAIKKYKSNT